MFSNIKLYISYIKVAAHLFRPEPPPNLPTPQIRSEPTRYAHTKADASDRNRSEYWLKWTHWSPNSWASPATATHLPSAHAQPLRTIRTIRKNIFQRIPLRFGCDLTRRFRSDLKRCAQSGRKACIRFPSDISVLFWRVGSGLIWTSVRQPLVLIL